MQKLKATLNPHPGNRMKVSLSLAVAQRGEKATLNLTYLPDREVLPPADFTAWVQAQAPWHTWEELGGRLLKEFYDEVLPQEATLVLDVVAKGGAAQRVELSVQQPQAGQGLQRRGA